MCSVIVVYITTIQFSNTWGSNVCLLTIPYLRIHHIKVVFEEHRSYCYMKSDSEHRHASSGEKRKYCIVNETGENCSGRSCIKSLYHHKAREKGLKEYVMGDLLRIHKREIKIFVISRLYLFH